MHYTEGQGRYISLYQRAYISYTRPGHCTAPGPHPALWLSLTPPAWGTSWIKSQSQIDVLGVRKATALFPDNETT